MTEQRELREQRLNIYGKSSHKDYDLRSSIEYQSELDNKKINIKTDYLKNKENIIYDTRTSKNYDITRRKAPQYFTQNKEFLTGKKSLDLKNIQSLQTIRQERLERQDNKNVSFLDNRERDNRNIIDSKPVLLQDNIELKTNKYNLTVNDHTNIIAKEKDFIFQENDKIIPKLCIYKIMKEDQEYADIERQAPIEKIPSKIKLKYYLIINTYLISLNNYLISLHIILSILLTIIAFSTRLQNISKADVSNYIIGKVRPYPQIIIDNFKDNINGDLTSAVVCQPLNFLYFFKDKRIFIWDYENEDLQLYEDMESKILNIHITKPDRNHFSSEVKELIIVANYDRINILAITLNENFKNKREHRLVISKTPIDIPLTEDDIVKSICSTITKRIFIGSMDNHLYEIDYSLQREYFMGIFPTQRKPKITKDKQSFFTKFIPSAFKSKSYYVKLVVDNSRHLLYGLTHFAENEEELYVIDKVTDSQICIYDLGKFGVGRY